VTCRAAIALILALSPVSLVAQWIHRPTPGTPRTPDGKPNLTAPAPKAADGNPDLSGIWQLDAASLLSSNVAIGLLVSQGLNFNLQWWRSEGAEIPMQPWAEALYNQRLRNFGTGRPAESCLPHSIPDAMVVGNFKIIQDPGLTLILYEEFARFRQIFTDGRAAPEDPNPAWFGYSTGKWDQGAFVVDTVGFNDRSWLDDTGHPHTEAMHTIERFRRTDFGHMDLELTIEDPKAYTQPWSVNVPFVLLPDTELIEDVCDNEKDDSHLVGRVAADNQKAVNVAPEILAQYAGAYEFPVPNSAPQVLRVSIANGKLVLFGIELTPVSETEFSGLGGTVRFGKDGQGIMQMTLRIIGAPVEPKGTRK
jgi:hypothetical protein